MADRREEVSDDDGFSFASDLTIEPEDDSISSSGPRPPNNKRITWKSPADEEGNGDDERNCRVYSAGTGVNRQTSNINNNPSAERNANSSPYVVSNQMQQFNNPTFRPQVSDSNEPEETRMQQLLRLVLQLLPSLCFTCVVQFIDLMAGVHLYVIGLVIFQSLFWPSLAFLIYSKYGLKNDIFSSLTPCSGGRWINSVLLQVQSVIVSGALLLQFLSIQYLDITVSLAMSFLPIIIRILMQHIIHEKKCSLELIVCSLTGYLGVILISIPSLTAKHPYIQSLIYNGVAASIASSLLTIQASFILVYLRRQGVNDSLLTAAIGLKGTLFCVIAGCVMHVFGAKLSGSNAGFIASIVVLTVIGISTLFFLTQCKMQGVCMRKDISENEEGSNRETDSMMKIVSPFASVVKQRVLIFVFSCVWGMFRQFHRHSFPNAFSVLGVTLIIIAFLFTMGFREWYSVTKTERLKIRHTHNELQQESSIQRKRRFEFVPWLFKRDPVLFTPR